MSNTIIEEFTRDDLENGMILETKSGIRFLVIEDDLVGLKHTDSLSHFSYTLEHNIADFLTIVKVYESENPTILSKLLDDEHLKLIWERK